AESTARHHRTAIKVAQFPDLGPRRINPQGHDRQRQIDDPDPEILFWVGLELGSVSDRGARLDGDPGAGGDFGFPLAALDLRAQRLIIQGEALAIDPLERFVQLLPGEGSVVDLTVRSHGVAAVVVRETLIYRWCRRCWSLSYGLLDE